MIGNSFLKPIFQDFQLSDLRLLKGGTGCTRRGARPDIAVNVREKAPLRSGNPRGLSRHRHFGWNLGCGKHVSINHTPQPHRALSGQRLDTIYLSTYPFIHLPIYLSVSLPDKRQNNKLYIIYIHTPYRLDIYINVCSLNSLCVVLAELYGTGRNDCSPTTKNSCLAMELGTPSVDLGLKSQATKRWRSCEDDEFRFSSKCERQRTEPLNLNISWETTSRIFGWNMWIDPCNLRDRRCSDCGPTIEEAETGWRTQPQLQFTIYGRGSRMSASLELKAMLVGYILLETNKSCGIRVMTSTNYIHKLSQLYNPTAVFAYPGFCSGSGSGFGLGKQRRHQSQTQCLKPNSQ